MAVDLDNTTIYFYKNNALIQTVTGMVFTGPLYFALTTATGGSSSNASVNFGQQPFTYTPPTGFRSLCSTNLPTPTIVNGASYMDATLYTGTGATLTINNGANSGNNPLSETFYPDLTWIKSRSAATNNNLFDSVRGATDYLNSNNTNAEATDANTLTAFGGTGFTLGSDASNVGVNISGNTYVGWQWNAGSGVTSSNTDGSITSTVSVNPTSGFSVIYYTGNGVSGATIGHGLGATPSLIILKRTNGGGTNNWPVYSSSLASTNVIFLNLTNAAAADSTYFTATAPTNSVFSVGTSADINANGGTYTGFLWAPIAGYSAFGSYTANGSADGPYVYCGFRPRFVIIKQTSTTGSWGITDTSCNPFNVAQNYLAADLANAEGSIPAMDFLSNGFKIRGAAYNNNNGATVFYMAFAENPFKFALAR